MGRGQPLLVGTVSIEKSEHLADLLKKKKIPHNVLNARYHEQEAFIIAQAGRVGGVTIATNMAGRGTDIQLGGNLEMRVRQETDNIDDDAKRAAKIDRSKVKSLKIGKRYWRRAGSMSWEPNAMRAGASIISCAAVRVVKGDPGKSKFFVSLEDDLMRIFGSERMDTMLRKLGLEEGEAIVHPWINKALEKAQQKVEARNFDIRKNLLKFDDVMNDQRKVIYDQRKEIMFGK